MNRQVLLRRAGVAALVMALGAGFLMEKEDAPVAMRRAAEPDLFAFIKPMPPALSSTPAQVPADEPLHASPTRGQPTELVEQAGVRHSSPTPIDIAATEQEAQRMRSQGASEDDIYRMRAHALSTEAAARLAEMEHAESTWQHRIHTYLSERERLLAAQSQRDSALATESLRQLRNTYFSAEEQERLAAYESPLVPQLTPH